MPRNAGKLSIFCLLAVVTSLSAQDAGKAKPVFTPAADSPKPRSVAVIYEVRSDGTNWRKLFEVPGYQPCNSPRISADGRRLSFDAWKAHEKESSTNARVIVCNLDGSDLKELCIGAMPSWSPDGRQFVCSRYGEQQGVWLMEADGQKGELLDAAGWGIQWSPDGASVAYSRGRNVVVRQLATGDERLLFPAMIAPYSTIFWNMTWSPDSRKIAMIAATEGGVREVAVVDSQGAEFGFARRASGHFNPMLSWNADGQRLVFPERTPTRMELRELNPTTNDASIPVPGIPPEAKIASACWIPDGSRLIVLCNSR